MTIDHKKQAPVKYSCGTPVESCTGSVDARFGGKNSNKKSVTLHSSISEARLCFERYLIEQGFKRNGSGTWSLDGDEPLKMA